MGKLIELKLGDKTILVESSDVEGESRTLMEAGATEMMEKSLDKMLDVIKPFCELLVNNLKNLIHEPKSISAEFGLSFSAEGNVFFVKASGEGSIKITLMWEKI